MKYFHRHMEGILKEYANTFRAVGVIGPRQSGKTTLTRHTFPGKKYINFEDPSSELLFTDENARFWEEYNSGGILDEAQRVPGIFRQLHPILDNTRERGQFILSGSSNFLLQEQISQSLAGRVGYLELLPLSYAELVQSGEKIEKINTLILNGGYPEIWEQQINPSIWMKSYVRTYLEKDVRMLRNITHLGSFNRFLHLCAGYAGQLVNREAIARKCGIDSKTVAAWLSILESSYIIYPLQPYYKNFNKRLIKSPKLYFYDTGLLCYLLGIHRVEDLENNDKYGAIFENWVITEIKKNRINQNEESGMYFFRDNVGNEVDLIIEKNQELLAIEIKAGKKIKSNFFTGLKYWRRNTLNDNGMVIYDGKQEEDHGFQVVGWERVRDV